MYSLSLPVRLELVSPFHSWGKLKHGTSLPGSQRVKEVEPGSKLAVRLQSHVLTNVPRCLWCVLLLRLVAETRPAM